MLADHFAAGTLEIPALGRALHYRKMRAGDLPAIIAIEKELFSSPWSEEMFREDLDQEYALSLVVLDGETIAAYVVTFLVLDEMHIANVAVIAAYQRRGIAFAMLKRLLTAGREMNYFLAHLEVRVSNTGAIALYEQLGFARVGLRKDYYEVEHEDAVLMSCRLQSNPLFAS